MGQGYGKLFRCKNYTAFKVASNSKIQEQKGSDFPWLNQGLQQSTGGTTLPFFNKLSNEIRGQDHTE